MDLPPFLRQPVKTHSIEWRIESWDCHAGSSPRSSSWPPSGGWKQGVSLAEVARGLEVSPNVLHRWRREFRQAPGNAFPGNGKRRWSEGRDRGAGAQDRSAGGGDRFFEGVLAAHRGTADVAGIDWKSAVYRKVAEEVNADRKTERSSGW
jgi:hypothetical protein